jgi:CRP/FNR family transcriptional regulator, polysaccharide utilization system transcription regulator
MSKPAVSRCPACGVRDSGCFSGLGVRAFGRLCADVGAHAFERGQLLFYAGASAHSLFVIRSGRIKVFASRPGGEERVLRLLGPGEILGYRPLFAREPYNASAMAVSDAVVCIVPWDRLLELVRAEPDLALELMAKLARELRVSEDLMMDLVCRPVRQRVARLLLSLVPACAAGPAGEVISSRELQRKDIARMVGTTPETLSRVLRSFARAQMVGLTRGGIRIRSRVLLLKAAGGPQTP